MKVKYLAFLFLLFSEFALGQVPGMPRFPGKSLYPQAFAASQITSLSAAVLTGYVIDNGQRTATETGLLWGSSAPTLTDYDGGVVSKSGAGTVTTTITGLVIEQIVYLRAYAKMGEDIVYGNVEIYEHGTVTTETGRKWMSFNLGSSPANSSNDANAYNTLYQWGRRTDGHEIKTSAVNQITVLSSLPTTYNAGSVGSSFIQPYKGGANPHLYFNAADRNRNSEYADWVYPENSRLWQGVNGLNNPCPGGYRIPSASEFAAEVIYWATKNQTGAFNSKLKLSTGGWRSFITPGTSNTNSANGYYWTSTTGTNVNEVQKAFVLNTSNGTLSLDFKSMGYAVRCIKEYSGSFMSSGGTAQVSSYDCPNSGAQGQLTNGYTPAQKNVKQIIQANVTTIGTYNLTTNYTQAHRDLYGYNNGIIFTGSGTFTSTGWQNVTLTATGNIQGPIGNAISDKTYYLVNVAPSCDFIRTERDEISGGTAILGAFEPNNVSINNATFTVNSTAQVSHYIKISLSYGGTVNMSASATDAEGNTVTFTLNQSFAGGCCQNAYFLSSGKFVVPGNYTFTLPNGYSFTRRWQ
jgi:uncharacterized protein (TIGR02145 family)